MEDGTTLMLLNMSEMKVRLKVASGSQQTQDSQDKLIIQNRSAIFQSYFLSETSINIFIWSSSVKLVSWNAIKLDVSYKANP